VLAGGAEHPRDLKAAGAAKLKGFHFAMGFPGRNRIRSGEGDTVADQILATRQKRVVIIGGGDTGADWPRDISPPGRGATSPQF